jgi:hypothetical protein
MNKPIKKKKPDRSRTAAPCSRSVYERFKDVVKSKFQPVHHVLDTLMEEYIEKNEVKIS